ncbi:hypothetical protein B0H67DRAFT_582230 [Lasiosphaeris hirsuta]|uniref:Uncharacterized protein n=1 Tax=Lasiosphaeris hirsuta TaxID=260670 RepID=A0AA40AHM4_9PEZI|nr:hypothetical protein B0H67DRAFT_582230 [Lasiosphaeris hirsuta]
MTTTTQQKPLPAPREPHHEMAQRAYSAFFWVLADQLVGRLAGSRRQYRGNRILGTLV